jgi:hypothetical protein
MSFHCLNDSRSRPSTQRLLTLSALSINSNLFYVNCLKYPVLGVVVGIRQLLLTEERAWGGLSAGNNSVGKKKMEKSMLKDARRVLISGKISTSPTDFSPVSLSHM